MEKKQFVLLLYIFGIVPMIYEFNNHIIGSWWWVSFGLLNMLVLMICAIVFKPTTTPSEHKKKKISLIVIWSLLIGMVLIAWLSRFSTIASLWISHNVLAPSIPSVSQDSIQTSETDTGVILTGIITSGSTISKTLTDDITTPTYTKSTSIEPTTTDTFQKSDTNPATTADSTITIPTSSSTKAPLQTTSSTILSKWALNYAQVIPYLITTYNLNNASKNTTFTNISKTNPLYKAFNIAANRGMIRASINPSSKVSCNTYLVLKWLAAWRRVEYKSWDPFGPYRTTAFSKGEVNGCTAGAFVTKATL
jgi:hypothetical protein